MILQVADSRPNAVSTSGEHYFHPDAVQLAIVRKTLDVTAYGADGRIHSSKIIEAD